MTEIHFINVGYGDAALIVEKVSGKPVFSMMIDCGGDTVEDDDPAGIDDPAGGDDPAGDGGPNGSRITAADYLKSLGIESVDIVLLSHLHLDHAGGILSVVENCTVKELWTPYVPRKSAWGKDIRISGSLAPDADNLKKSLNLYTAALEILDGGNTVIRPISDRFSKELPFGAVCITVGEQSLIRHQAGILDTVFDEKGTGGLLSELHGFINETSLRAKLNLQGFIVLFTGDIDAAAWEKDGVTKADVVKLPHHGQPGSVNEAIARGLGAKYIVVSVSNTRRGCPDPGVIECLKRSGSRVLFTDAAGRACMQDAHQRHAVRFQIDQGVLIFCEDE